MDDAVRDHDVSGPISEWKFQVVAYDPGFPVAIHSKPDGNAAPVEADASNPPSREKTQYAPRTASDIENQGVNLQTIDQIHQQGRDDRMDSL